MEPFEAPLGEPTAARLRRARKVKALLAGGLVLGVGTSATLAAWTDTEQVSGEFTAGAFAIEANTDGNIAGAWSAARELTFDASGMYPGALVHAPALIRTTPDTTVDASLTLRGTAPTGGLASSLQFRVVTAPMATGAAAPTCDAASFSAGSEYVFGTASARVPVAGQRVSATTQVAPLGQGGLVFYCFEVELPDTVGNETQGQSAQKSWVWDAVSVAPEN